jgi:hypothetical protein
VNRFIERHQKARQAEDLLKARWATVINDRAPLNGKNFIF